MTSERLFESGDEGSDLLWFGGSANYLGLLLLSYDVFENGGLGPYVRRKTKVGHQSGVALHGESVGEWVVVKW